MADQVAAIAPGLETFIGRTKGEQIPRVPGAAVFFTGRLDQTPPSLQKLVRHSGVVYDKVIVLTVVFEPMPSTSGAERIEFTQVDEGF